LPVVPPPALPVAPAVARLDRLTTSVMLTAPSPVASPGSTSKRNEKSPPATPSPEGMIAVPSIHSPSRS
jgi:hypothetical protein